MDGVTSLRIIRPLIIRREVGVVTDLPKACFYIALERITANNADGASKKKSLREVGDDTDLPMNYPVPDNS